MSFFFKMLLHSIHVPLHHFKLGCGSTAITHKRRFLIKVRIKMLAKNSISNILTLAFLSIFVINVSVEIINLTKSSRFMKTDFWPRGWHVIIFIMKLWFDFFNYITTFRKKWLPLKLRLSTLKQVVFLFQDLINLAYSVFIKVMIDFSVDLFALLSESLWEFRWYFSFQPSDMSSLIISWSHIQSIFARWWIQTTIIARWKPQLLIWRNVIVRVESLFRMSSLRKI